MPKSLFVTLLAVILATVLTVAATTASPLLEPTLFLFSEGCEYQEITIVLDPETFSGQNSIDIDVTISGLKFKGNHVDVRRSTSYFDPSTAISHSATTNAKLSSDGKLSMKKVYLPPIDKPLVNKSITIMGQTESCPSKILITPKIVSSDDATKSQSGPLQEWSSSIKFADDFLVKTEKVPHPEDKPFDDYLKTFQISFTKIATPQKGEFTTEFQVVDLIGNAQFVPEEGIKPADLSCTLHGVKFTPRISIFALIIPTSVLPTTTVTTPLVLECENIKLKYPSEWSGSQYFAVAAADTSKKTYVSTAFFGASQVSDPTAIIVVVLLFILFLIAIGIIYFLRSKKMLCFAKNEGIASEPLIGNDY